MVDTVTRIVYKRETEYISKGAAEVAPKPSTLNGRLPSAILLPALGKFLFVNWFYPTERYFVPLSLRKRLGLAWLDTGGRL